MALVNETILLHKGEQYKEISSRDKPRSVVVHFANGNIRIHEDNFVGVVGAPKEDTIRAGTKAEIDAYILSNNLKPSTEAIK